MRPSTFSGIYHGVQNTDRATDGGGTNDALKIDEAVMSSTSLQNLGFNPVGKTLQFITFQNLRSTHGSPPVTDSVYSAAAIYSATLRDPAAYNQNFGPSGTASINVNPVTVGGTARVQVSTSRGGGSPNNIVSVNIDASSINQGTIVLNDSGINGDAHPNDSVWSRNVGFAVNATPGVAHLPFTITDGHVPARTFTDTLVFTINGPTGSATPASTPQEGTTLITVPLLPNTSQPTDIASVSIDASSIQSGTLLLNDSGTTATLSQGTASGAARSPSPVGPPSASHPSHHGDRRFQPCEQHGHRGPHRHRRTRRRLLQQRELLAPEQLQLHRRRRLLPGHRHQLRRSQLHHHR